MRRWDSWNFWTLLVGLEICPNSLGNFKAVCTQAKHLCFLLESAFLLLVVYPRKTSAYVCQQTSKIMFIACLFIIPPNWKKPKWPLTEELTNCGICTQWNESESHSVMSDSLWPYGILQVRILEWVAFPFSGVPSWLRSRIGVSCIAGRFFTNWAIREAQEGSTVIKKRMNCWYQLQLR